ncbi:hypothetical protein TorRG33x02_046020 [Trema orientale]|uniref:Hydroxyproline-rich glycoprotein family protein n=1 Tax=Trema orientale TaxID=63057 RepID=A0A2P5FNR6_TREOI|nr:hypothetical protein TorRG33x02_046020 [Trema orientale]
MMNIILLLLAFLVFLAKSPAHARILPAEIKLPRGEKYDMTISIYGKKSLSPPPPPSSSPPKKSSTGAQEPCDDVVQMTGKSELRAENVFESPLAHPSPRPSRPIIQMPGTKGSDDAVSIDHQSISSASTTTSQGDYRQLTTTTAAESLSWENMANVDGRRPPSPPPGPPGSAPIVHASSHASKWKTMWWFNYISSLTFN